MSEEKCPVVGCINKKPDWQLVCPKHWRQVPRQAQMKVWHLYKNAKGTDEQREYCFKVLALLNESANSSSRSDRRIGTTICQHGTPTDERCVLCPGGTP